MFKNLFVVVIFILFQQTARAEASLTTENLGGMAQFYSAEFIEIINQSMLEKDTAYMMGGTPISDACVSLMNKNQLVGTVGAAVYTEFSSRSELYPNLLDGGSVNKYCRKYSEMSKQQKALVWVFVMTTMAHFESSCNEKARAQGPNGIAYGYFQLHKGKENFYAPDVKSCVKNASTSAVLSSKCSMGMLEKQMDKSNGELFSNKSYWEVLRPRGPADKARIIAKALSRSSLCNPKMM